MFNTPILFIVFNRLNTTQLVFEKIKSVKPKQLFIAADGPRVDQSGEIEKCDAVRKWLIDAIDWEVDLKTMFRNENLGCGKGPVSAINWFFEHVESGIILEDDCLPADSFFPFCETLLNKYVNNTRIHSIAGTNLLSQYSDKDHSYFFSYQSGIWGWATWRRSWKLYDYYASQWQQEKVREKFNNFFENENERLVYVNGVERAFNERNVSWWDYQFIFSRIINCCYGIIPQKNLISNIGFGIEASHTFDINSELGFLPIEELDFPLIHPIKINVFESYDHLYRTHFFKLDPVKYPRNKLYNFLKKYITFSKLFFKK